jgi:hypothetical protein
MLFTSSAKRSLTLNLIALLILLVGFGSAISIWRAQDRIDRQDRKRRPVDIAAAPLAPDDSGRYTRDVEIYSGKTGLLLDKWTRWLQGLAHGKPLAKAIAALSLVVASGFFLVAKISRAEQ